ncbi:limbic system-associated membrane protein-like [Babylonia areolata]|uniref:limbic system-associated membrane protein-like n=1 Tax=Babylonia areolata TaxID=304850 RepID=UPI003FD3BC73
MDDEDDDSGNDMKRITMATTMTMVGVVSGLKPKMTMLRRNVTVVSGQTAVLPCSVDFLGTYKVVWLDHRGKLLTFEDRRIISDERISLERPYVKEWNLHVRNVRPSDAGNYTCQVNTNPIQIRSVFLHVHEPAKIINHLSSSQTVVVQEGDKVELVCNVTGVPKPTVNWFRVPKGLMHRSDRRQDPDQRKKQIGVSGEVLLIHNVSRYCDDEYECVAYNDVPPAAIRKIRVYVEFPPEVRLPNRKIGQSKGKTTILECVVTAYPHAITVWRRNGKVIERNSKYNIEVYDEDENTLTLALRIQSLTESDYGQYECVSKNQLGKDSETMILYEYPIVVRTTTTTTTTTRRHSTRPPHRHNNNNGRPYINNNNGNNNDDDDDYNNNGEAHPYYTQRPPQHKSRLPGSERQPLVGGEGDSDNDNDIYNTYDNGNHREGDGGPPYTYGGGPRNEQVIEPGSGGTTSSFCSPLTMGISTIVALALLR